MAELSPDSQAIVDRLKQEGNLVRNSGTHSIRSVKIQLDKFEEIFKTISNNISLQNDVLKMQTDIVKADAKNSEEESERARSEEQFEKLEPQNDSNDKKPLVTEAESKKINDIGDSIRNALSFKSMLTSFKNVALAGAGLFVGYNFLKGFIDEKTGGGFTEFEKNIGPFAKKLPIIGNSLEDFSIAAKDFKTDMREFKTSIGGMKTSIDDLKISIEKFKTDANKLGDDLTLLGIGAAAVAAIFGSIGMFSFGKEVAKLLNKLVSPGGIFNRGAGTPPTAPPGTTSAPRPAPAAGAPAGGAPASTTTAPGQRGAVSITPASAAPAPAATTARPSGGASSSRPGVAATVNQSLNTSLDDVEKSLSDPKMLKVFRLILRGLFVISITLTIAQAVQLAFILNDTSKTQKEKQVATGSFLGLLIGAGTGATTGALIGVYGGPWGVLIGAALGAGLGSLGGSMVGEYIARWAFGEGDPSKDDMDKIKRQIGLDAIDEKVSARPLVTANRLKARYDHEKQTLAGQKWDATYGLTHNIDGTPKTNRTGAGSSITPVSMTATERQMLAGLSEVGTNATRQNGLNTVASNNNAAAPIIINAPVSAPSSVNVSNGGSSVNQLSISGGGGGSLGPSMLPYGLTNAFS